jgi:pimeloyl-ACP methyl ester carboxylesterase
VRLAYRTWGEADAPPVVLVHGLTGTSRTWWRVGPALAAAGRWVVGVDLRGHGSSAGATPETTLADLAADVRETVDGRVDLVGHSLGALVALAFAGAYPDGVRRLVLEDPPSTDVRLDAVADDVLAAVARARAEPERFRAEVRAENPSWPEEDVENELLGHQECEAEPVSALIRRLRFDLLELLAAVRAPTLLVAGREERESRLTGDVRATAFGLVESVEHDAGHVVHRDDFDGYVRTLAAFLDRAD